MMILLRKLTKDHSDMAQVRELYETAFPVSERPLSMDETALVCRPDTV